MSANHTPIPVPGTVRLVFVNDPFGGHQSARMTCYDCGRECVRVYRSGVPDALAPWRHLPKKVVDKPS